MRSQVLNTTGFTTIMAQIEQAALSHAAQAVRFSPSCEASEIPGGLNNT